jgi:hypothetical protein
MFVEQERFRRNPKSILFTIRNCPLWVSNSERFASPILDRSCNSKAGSSDLQKLFDMQEERNFVTGNKDVSVTPAQFELLELLNHVNAADFAHHVKEVHELGTYFVTSNDLVNLSASLHVHWLYDAIDAIAQEQSINLKSA